MQDAWLENDVHQILRVFRAYSPWSKMSKGKSWVFTVFTSKSLFSVSPHFPIVSVAFQVLYLVTPDGRPRPRSRCSPPAGPRHGVARPWLVGNAKIASSWGDHMYIGSYWFILFDRRKFRSETSDNMDS